LILLDSNTIVYYLKGDENVVRRLQATSRRELAVSTVAAYELEYGTMRSSSQRRRSVIASLLKGLHHVPFDRAAAEQAARIRVDLERDGVIIGPLDLLIAGTAVSRGALLVTSNTREFARVKGLRLADWIT
jgi:tRNA(fMet)-specific endonuclease VapC